MNQVATIDRLVEVSEESTLSMRKKYGVSPEQVSETFARHAKELREAGRSFQKFEEKELFGKYLNVLANFPILKTEQLLLLQEVTLEDVSQHIKFPCTVQLPLFGMATYNSAGFKMNVRRWADTFHPQYADKIDELMMEISDHKDQNLPEKDSYLRLLRMGCGTIAGQLYGIRGRKGWRVHQIVPDVPQKIEQVANEAKKFGFTNLAKIWAPAEYALEEIPFEKDPLLIGTMFNTWWILDQWNVTDAEKKLVSPAED